MTNRLLILVVAIAALAALAIAETPAPTPDPKDNACYPGGSMDGRCEDDNHWNAGWYYARWEQGKIKREDFPVMYIWVLPPLLEPAEQAQGSSSGICYPFELFDSLLYTGPANTLGNFIYYAEPDCTGEPEPFDEDALIVFAEDEDEAEEICEDILDDWVFVDELAEGVYFCVID
ncbi:MAG: hypothetical protein NZ750_07470 [Anaerolineae bacterium]|nr:hypothetical protein [Anaerolineae bacterium]MDW8172187.1 hypothetical protein [Anaerolineae bacterium]